MEWNPGESEFGTPRPEGPPSTVHHIGRKRMRTMKTLLLITALVLTASAAHAGNMTFGLNGGVSSPTGDYSDNAKLGFNGGVYGDYWLKDNYAFGIDINGNFLSAKDDVIKALKLAA